MFFSLYFLIQQKTIRTVKHRDSFHIYRVFDFIQLAKIYCL